MVEFTVLTYMLQFKEKFIKSNFEVRNITVSNLWKNGKFLVIFESVMFVKWKDFRDIPRLKHARTSVSDDPHLSNFIVASNLIRQNTNQQIQYLTYFIKCIQANSNSSKRITVPGCNAAVSYILVFKNFAYENFFEKGQEL